MQGELSDGTIIAVKQLSSKSSQGNREFVNEIGMISGLNHPNLVKLYGCCVERDQLLLVYEYMENNSLALALFGKLMSFSFPLRFQSNSSVNICYSIQRDIFSIWFTSIGRTKLLEIGLGSKTKNMCWNRKRA